MCNDINIKLLQDLLEHESIIDYKFRKSLGYFYKLIYISITYDLKSK